MEHYFKDLKTILNENNELLKEDYALYLTRQILYAFEFIHSNGYAHADLKASNLMLKNDHQFYLVNYGSCFRFQRDNQHCRYQENTTY
jgi:vaccinia related kinase